MKGMKMYFKLACLFSIGLILFNGCKSSTPVPTATITSSIRDNVVTFNVVASNASTFTWSFGDGTTSGPTISSLMTHIYQNYGSTYNVTLNILGPGGQISETTTIILPAETQMEMLTGGSALTAGQAWTISPTSPIVLANPDAAFSVIKTYPAGILTSIGLGHAYTDQYIFFSNGNYTINNVGGGALAGLSYCTANNIRNVSTQASAGVGLTYLTTFTPWIDLGFIFTPANSLTVPVTTDGLTTTNVTYNNVTTLNFSKLGFLGVLDFMNTCIIQSLSNTEMTVAIFVSVLPPESPMVGKITNVLLVTFQLVNAPSAL